LVSSKMFLNLHPPSRVGVLAEPLNLSAAHRFAIKNLVTN
jgi:hypothetical protein